MVAWIQMVVATQVDLCAEKKLSEELGGGCPVEGFAWAVVEFVGHAFQIRQGLCAEIGALGKVAPVKLLRRSDVFFFYAAAIWRRAR